MLRRISFLLAVPLVLYGHSASAVSFLVTTNADTGPGSLRQAILDANTTPGPDAIYFSVGSGSSTIKPLSPLPPIVEAVAIDARTQPGYSNAPIIELDGALTSHGPGLGFFAASQTMGASGSMVAGLVINGF